VPPRVTTDPASRSVARKHPDLLEAFAGIVARRPEHVAVEAPEGSFSFAALDSLANRFANRLRALGVNRESPVGISLPRGALELVAMLATLKAGGAYVPLELSLPVDRLLAIVEDARPEVVLVHPSSPLVGLNSTEVLRIDDLDSAVAGFPDVPPAGVALPDQLAYVLFTSGSTGRPKGVEVTRDAFANFLGSMIHTPGLSQDDRLLAVTTTSFDIAGLELFLPLCVGATTVIVDRETARDPRRLRPRLEGERITVFQATPATWRLLLDAGWSGDGKLKMLCGGEALSPALADRLLAAGGQLWNVYGPTETTVWSSLALIERGYDRITIGAPIDETTMYVLDQALQPVPAGQEGEIWIGGRGLARGYRGRPDLTAERFVSDPRGGPGARMYRTGDLGRQLPDGRFLCLGRIDHQVKIRGFRVELGEVEATLRKVPGVAEVLVVADEHLGDPRLIAYWSGSAEREPLIEAARSNLPAYMVPAAYARLEAFPLNSNGKIDRKRLPKPEAVAALDLPTRALPRSDTEVRIAAIWSEALGLPTVPVDESFFTLGGTSALAVEVAARLERELKVPVPLQAFFTTPTVEGIAASLGTAISPTDPIVVRLARGEPGVAPLFCLFGVHLYQDLALALREVSNHPVIGMHIPIRFVPGVDQLPRVGDVARRYAELIRSHQPTGPYHLLGLCFGGVIAYEVARLFEEAGQKVAVVTIIDAILPTAVRTDAIKRLRRHVERARQEPRAAAREVLARLKALRSQWPSLQRPDRAHEARQPIELPVEGPEIDAEVGRFSAKKTLLATRVLVVRAVDPPPPGWQQVDLDQGWRGRAAQVIYHDIRATHLGVLRMPHVRSLAKAIAQVEGA